MEAIYQAVRNCDLVKLEGLKPKDALRAARVAASINCLRCLDKLVPQVLAAGLSILPVTTEAAHRGNLEVINYLVGQITNNGTLEANTEGIILDAMNGGHYHIVEMLLDMRLWPIFYLNELARVAAARPVSSYLLPRLMELGVEDRDIIIHALIEGDNFEELAKFDFTVNLRHYDYAVNRLFHMFIEFGFHDFLALEILVAKDPSFLPKWRACIVDLTEIRADDLEQSPMAILEFVNGLEVTPQN